MPDIHANDLEPKGESVTRCTPELQGITTTDDYEKVNAAAIRRKPLRFQSTNEKHFEESKNSQDGSTGRNIQVDEEDTKVDKHPFLDMRALGDTSSQSSTTDTSPDRRPIHSPLGSAMRAVKESNMNLKPRNECRHWHHRTLTLLGRPLAGLKRFPANPSEDISTPLPPTPLHPKTALHRKEGRLTSPKKRSWYLWFSQPRKTSERSNSGLVGRTRDTGIQTSSAVQTFRSPEICAHGERKRVLCPSPEQTPQDSPEIKTASRDPTQARGEQKITKWSPRLWETPHQISPRHRNNHPTAALLKVPGQGTKLACDKIKRDIKFLKEEVAKLDERDDTMKQDSTLNRHFTSQQGANPARVQSVEKRGMVKGTFACTPTTTTTGFGRPTYKSNPRGVPVKAPNGNLASTLQSCKKLTLREANAASEILSQRQKPSSLLKLTPDWQIIPIDITPTSSHDSNHPIMGNRAILPTPFSDRKRFQTQGESKQFSMSQTYTSIPDQRDPMVITKAGLPMRTPKRHIYPPKGPRTMPQVSSPPSKHKVIEGIQARILPERQAQVRGSRRMGSLGCLMARYPGTYPSHQDAVGGIDGRFVMPTTRPRHGRINTDKDNGELYRTHGRITSVVSVASHQLEALMRLSWILASPFFNASFACWTRWNRGEIGVVDGVMFVLAIPGAVLGVFLLM